MINHIREKFLPYCLPDITTREIDEVVDTLNSGWITKGPKTIDFEKKFAEFIGAKYAVGVNSCTAALHVALLTNNIGIGDEVITTPMTFASSVSTIVHTGATPVFVDIDGKTGCIDADRIEDKITSKTKAIVPVHYSGQACDLDKIYKVADKYNLVVSEDAAHAVGTFYKGRRIGCNVRNVASFSFYATKNLTTGEGGMLITDDEDIATRARVLISHGMSANAWNRYAKGGTWMYDIEVAGYKYNMFDIQAAMGIVQLQRIDEMQQKRIDIARKYDAAFITNAAIELNRITPDTTHSRHLYIIKLNLDKLSIDRNDFINELNNRNIGTSVHFIPVHFMSFYRNNYGYQEGDFPVTEEYFNRILSIPLYSTMSDEDIDYVIGSVNEITKAFSL